MRRLASTLLLVLIINVLITGCTSNNSSQSSTSQSKTVNSNKKTVISEQGSAVAPAEPPEIKIAIDGKQLEYVVAKNSWDGVMYDREDTFETILKKTPLSSIPYIKTGSTVEIDFGDNPPDKLTVLDLLIDENGNQMYSDKEIITIPVELTDDETSFKIEKHMASALSSSSILDKKNIRGFRIIAGWKENECEYAFIIKSDAY